MKNSAVLLGAILFTLTVGGFLSRAEEERPLGRVGMSYRAAFNVSADFSRLGGFNPAGNPGDAGRIVAPPGTIVRNYDDGFIGIDISGNANGHTTFWGYEDSGTQVVGDSVRLHSSSSPSTSHSRDVTHQPQHGFELNYLHPIGGGEKWHWGAEGAFNWTGVRIKDDRTVAGNVIVLPHSFALTGVVPPVAPPSYVGPIDGPGAPQISDEAMVVGDAVQRGAARVAGTRKIEADIYGGRLGPYAELQMSPRLSLAVGVGFSFGLIDSTFSYNDTTTIGGLGSQNNLGAKDSTGWVYGGYLRGQTNVRINKSGSLFLGVEGNRMGQFNQTAKNGKASLDLGSVLYAFAGFAWSF